MAEGKKLAARLGYDIALLSLGDLRDATLPLVRTFEIDRFRDSSHGVVLAAFSRKAACYPLLIGGSPRDREWGGHQDAPSIAINIDRGCAHLAESGRSHESVVPPGTTTTS